MVVGGTVMNAINSSTTQHCINLPTSSEEECVAIEQGAKTALFTKGVLDFLQPEY